MFQTCSIQTKHVNRSAAVPLQVRETFAEYFWYTDYKVLEHLIKQATRKRWSMRYKKLSILELFQFID